MSGKYLRDGLHAEVRGDGIVIGINSNDLLAAILHRFGGDYARAPIEAWVMRRDAPNVRWIDD